jgi:NAD(P)-dependent dehydrogenase (short-subunit alcohol dehydrogenase family)
MSLYGMLSRPGPSGFGYASTAEQVSENLDLTGKRVLVTGCSSGLGLETARVLAMRGATVLGTARTVESATAALSPLNGSTVPLACELSEPASVRACVAEVAQGEPLDVLLCNAGIMALPERTVKHGYELQFLTNHIGHFLLVTGLLGKLKPGGRVVMLSSSAHTRAPAEGIRFDDLDASKSYSAWTAYGQAKLANLLFARELARRLDEGRTANAVHPGVIATNLGRHMSAVARIALGIAGPLVLKSAPEGAATQTYVAVHPGVAETTGEYFADCNVAESSAQGKDLELAKRLYEVSEEIAAKL